jgi:hypothetical protein
MYAALDTMPTITVIIEGEARGADTYARVYAERNNIPIEKYPADWKRYGLAAGPIRNRQMLMEGKPDLVMAFAKTTLAESRGTKNMVKQARKAGVRVQVFEENSIART